MSFDAETLYNLLPSVYRVRDADQGKLLHEVVQIIADQVAVVEENLEQLYDDQFIETCAEWVVPYIGDLIGYRDLHTTSPLHSSSRAEVANTIGFRRRKGAISMLEQLAKDITGRETVAVEYFQRIAATQYMNHVRLNNRITDVGDIANLSMLESPFDEIPHSIDVRHISNGGGYYNIPNIALFFWRIRSQPIHGSPPVEIDARRFLFSPLGDANQLYNRPQTETSITYLATPENAPLPLQRRYLSQHLQMHYGENKSLLLYKDGLPVDIDELHICDLSNKEGGAWANMPVSGVAIDPELGRLAFSDDVDSDATPLRCNFHYGFSTNMGGGEYDRSSTLSLDEAIQVPGAHTSLKAALDSLSEDGVSESDVSADGVIEITDSGRYQESVSIRCHSNQKLVLQAANNARPAIISSGKILLGGAGGSEITLNGLLISGGGLFVPASIDGVKNRLRRLHLKHCTLTPGLSLDANGSPEHPDSASLVVETENTIIEIESCILGSLQINENARVSITDSIIDATTLAAEAYSGTASQYGAPLTICNSTVIGEVHTRTLPYAANNLFLSLVRTEHIQEGCVRFSYILPGSRVPRRYRSLPQSDDQIGHPRKPGFVSLRYGDPGYGLLLADCNPEILRGADDESEMGAFHSLYQAQRENNLRIRLEEYLRFGMEPGIIYFS